MCGYNLFMPKKGFFEYGKTCIIRQNRSWCLEHRALRQLEHKMYHMSVSTDPELSSNPELLQIVELHQRRKYAQKYNYAMGMRTGKKSWVESAQINI